MNDKVCTCKKPAVTDFGHLGPLCKDCFIDVIYKRCRKAVRDFGWLKPNQKVHLMTENSLRGKALDALFKQVVKGLPLDYVAAEQAEVIIIGKTADDEAEEFLNQLFAGKIEQKNNALNLLANISTAEIEKYCELEGIAGSKPAKSELRIKLEGLEQRYRGTMFSLQKSKNSFQ